MGKPVIIINSVTQAMKAKQILARQGVYSEVLKNRTGRVSDGCSYNLIIKGNVSRAEMILKNAGISIVGIAEV